MRIEVEHPFSPFWTHGYTSHHPNGRKIVSLHRWNLLRKTISFARYVMSVNLGYVVPDNLEVDHIDSDCTNDSLSNLQLLTPEENKKKDNSRRSEELHRKITSFKSISRTCDHCGGSYELSFQQEKSRRENNKARGITDPLNFCSRRCIGKFYITNGVTREGCGRIGTDMKKLWEASNQATSKSVTATHINGSRLTFGSQSSAAKHFGVCRSRVQYAINNGRTINGFSFEKLE